MDKTNEKQIDLHVIVHSLNYKLIPKNNIVIPSLIAGINYVVYLMLICVIASIFIQPVSAVDYIIIEDNGTLPQQWMELNTNYNLENFVNSAGANAYCVGKLGAGSTISSWAIYGWSGGYPTTTGDILNLSGQSYVGGVHNTYTPSGSITFSSASYSALQRQRVCSYGTNTYNYINPVWGRVDYLQYRPAGLSGSFTVIPSSGNNTLEVRFTPVVNVPKGLNYISWDFGTSLINPETKNDAITFNKTYTIAGHYVARMTVYDNESSSITASQNIDVYNYTAGITPTPTLTPTPTPTPQTNQSGNWQVTIRDYSNDTIISGVSIGLIDTSDVGSGWFNVTAANGVYTFGGYGSGGNKPFVIGHEYYVQASKTSYTSGGGGLIYNGGSLVTGYALTPLSLNPSSTTFALNVFLKDTTKDSSDVIQGVSGTVKISNQSSSWTTTSTATSEKVIFNNLKPIDSYNLQIDINGFESYNGVFVSSSSMAGTNQYYQAYLTPSSSLPSGYSLSVTPSSGKLTDTYTLKTTGDLTTASTVSYKFYSGSNRYLFNVGAGYSEYKLVGGNWKQWDGSSYSISSSLPQTMSGTIPTSSTDKGLYNAIVYITTTSGATYQATSQFTILNSGSVKATFLVWDASSSLTQLYPHELYVHDLTNGVWTNKTVTSSALFDGSNSISYNVGTELAYYASAIGYTDSVLSYGSVDETDKTFNINMYPTTMLVGNNMTLYANVRASPMLLTVPNALVTFSEGSNTSTCYSNNNGQCSITARNDTTYKVTATGVSGYLGATTTIHTSLTDKVVYLTLLPINPSTTTFSPVTYTSVQTTSIYGGNNTMPTPALWDDTNAYTCGSGNSSTLLGYFKEQLSCNGCTTGMCQSLVTASLIMLICLSAGAKYGKGIGAGIGGVIGFVLSFALGLIPFMILALLIALLVLLCAVIFFNKGSG